MIRCGQCVDLHRPCAECTEWQREAEEDARLAEGPYVGTFVRTETLRGLDANDPAERAGQRIVQRAIQRAAIESDPAGDPIIALAMEVFGKVGLPHVGGTAIPAEVLVERARNLAAVLLCEFRLVPREAERRSPTDEEFANEEAIS